MILLHLRANRVLIIWAFSAGLVMSAFAMSLQIDLWLERGKEWNGAFAAIDYDEPFYAAYVQSLIDGKPRRNSPYTGLQDSTESPQKESYLSIQFLASYPTAVAANLCGLSSSTAMIVLTPVIGFLSALCVFWLALSLLESPPAAFAITLLVLLCGGVLAGQGGVSSFVSPDTVHYSSSFLFLRRSVPAISFPALFLFFALIWRLFNSVNLGSRIVAGVGAMGSFTFTVYGYFYHWTIALGWFVGLVILWATFRFEDLRTNKVYIFGAIGGVLVTLAPYFILMLNRAAEADSELMLRLTHQPDLLRIPCVISYLTIFVILVSAAVRIIDLRSPNIIFLLSLAFVPLIVFNQQMITGRSLQPFHYQLFGANYIALFALCGTLFLILRGYLGVPRLNMAAGFVCVLALSIGLFDTLYAAGVLRGYNIWRDELFLVGKRIREMDATNPPDADAHSYAVLSFDFTAPFPVDSTELPGISSRPVVWSPHLAMFPNTNSEITSTRLSMSLYYQNLDNQWVLRKLGGGDNFLALAFFGGIRSNDPDINESEFPTPEQITEVSDRYGKFVHNFNFDTARSLPLSYVIARTDQKVDLSTVDRWYDRSIGETVGRYVIYRVTLRPHQNG